jgi:peptide/nickel transport system permease protein
MASYVFRRFLQSLAVILGVSFITFALPSLMGGNVAKAVLGPHSTHHDIVQFLHEHGLDRPFLVQYYHYMVDLLHGNLGTSLNAGTLDEPVTKVIGPALPRTFWLVTIPLVISVVISVVIGLFQGLRRNTWFDHSATFVVFLLYSFPAFLFSEFSIIVFGLTLHWFPVSIDDPTKYGSGFFSPLRQFFSSPGQFVLPIATLTVLGIGGLTRFVRGSILDTMVQDYVRTARAKGCSPRQVLFRHMFRNAILPVVTILGLSLPGLFGGALITEEIFNYPGMGLLGVQATNARDVPVVMGITLLITIMTVLGNLLADIGIAIADPRIRISGGAK